MNTSKHIISTMAFFLCLVLCSCVGTAKLSEFPKSAANVDFSKYSTEMNNNRVPFWTFETSNEYYIEKVSTIDETNLNIIIEKALRDKGYKIKSSSRENRAFIAKRGLRFNEWSSVTGVYYQISSNKTQIYISTYITQDATGGVRNNIAKKVGLLIEAALQQK